MGSSFSEHGFDFSFPYIILDILNVVGKCHVDLKIAR